MRRLAFNPRFINEQGNDLIPGKIHTLRRNYEWWKKHEGKEVELFTWEGKPYRSTQKVFCIKRLERVGRIELMTLDGQRLLWWHLSRTAIAVADDRKIAINDGFKTTDEFYQWFKDYPDGMMAILYFTDFQYF